MSSHRHTNENNNTVINDKLHSAVETSSTCANERLDDKEDIRNRKHLNSTTTSRQNNPYEEASFFSRVRTTALKFLPFTFFKKRFLTNIQMEITFWLLVSFSFFFFNLQKYKSCNN